MSPLEHIFDVILWVALGVLAYYGEGWAALFILAWALMQRHEIGRLRATAIYWKDRATKLTNTVDHLTAEIDPPPPPSPEEELLVETRRRVLMQWKEEQRE